MVDLIRSVVLLVVLVLAAGVGAMLWQHLRYLHARRALAQDRQPLLHSADAFHVVTFLELAPGGDVFEEVRKLRDLLESGRDARMVYAGKVALNALASAQLARVFGEEVAWDAIVAVQLPSREAWERIAASEGYRRALAGFRRTYAHGMKRWPWVNLALPQALLAKRLQQIATGAPSHFPLEPASETEQASADTSRIERLADERELGGRAIVIVNLLQTGTPEQAAANRAYGNRMLGLMAERGHGPLHMGEAVTLEHGAQFDSVALVWYPGVDYFMDLARSRFFQGIVGDKQLADTQATITVPILDRI